MRSANIYFCLFPTISVDPCYTVHGVRSAKALMADGIRSPADGCTVAQILDSYSAFTAVSIGEVLNDLQCCVLMECCLLLDVSQRRRRPVP